MAYEWAKPGIKCVCITSKPQTGTDYRGVTRLPVINEVLTIRYTSVTIDGDTLLRFHEIRNPKAPTTEGVIERGYSAKNFRPLISQADDVEMFRRISEDSLGRLECYEELLNEQFLCDETHE